MLSADFGNELRRFVRSHFTRERDHPFNPCPESVDGNAPAPARSSARTLRDLMILLPQDRRDCVRRAALPFVEGVLVHIGEPGQHLLQLARLALAGAAALLAQA